MSITTTTDEPTKRLMQLHEEREAITAKIRELQRERAGRRELPAGLTVLDASGAEVPLADLFGASDDLLLVHNMGSRCSWCSMWADGLSGLYEQIVSRAPMVVVSRDEPAVQQELRERRGWRFPMYSTPSGEVHQELGFLEGEGIMPGYSALKREADGRIVQVSSDYFGPGDLYNAAWPMFDMLDSGVDGWQPLPPDRAPFAG